MSQRIVVCDDDRHIVLAVSMKLSKAGFKVESAGDGQGAWARAGLARGVAAAMAARRWRRRMAGIVERRCCRLAPSDARSPALAKA